MGQPPWSRKDATRWSSARKCDRTLAQRPGRNRMYWSVLEQSIRQSSEYIHSDLGARGGDGPATVVLEGRNPVVECAEVRQNARTPLPSTSRFNSQKSSHAKVNPASYLPQSIPPVICKSQFHQLFAKSIPPVICKSQSRQITRQKTTRQKWPNPKASEKLI